jgi:hypothetical protein
MRCVRWTQTQLRYPLHFASVDRSQQFQKHMIRQISLIIISIGLLSCRQSNSTGLTNIIDSSKIMLDSILYDNYLKAIDNESTFQFFLVAKIKDLNTGQIREICTQGNFLKGALHREYDINYDSIGTLKVYHLATDNHKRYFEFKNDSAIWNICGVWPYSMDDLIKLERQIDFDSLAQQIKKDNKWSMKIFDDKTMLMYAHSLFNRGILTGENNCFGGTLIFVEDKWIEERKEQQMEMKRQMDLIKKDKK